MEVFADLGLENAECPVWNPVEQVFYWTDIPRGRMYRCAPGGEPQLVHEAGQQIGALVVAEDGSIVQGLEEGRVQIWKDGHVRVICEGIAAERGRRFNDGTADPMGRLLLGTMPGDGPAVVYVFEAGGKHRLLLGELGQANGIAFSLDGAKLYATDTKAKVIWRFDYDVGDGLATNGTPFARVESAGTVPDGLTMDELGCLWSARWGGACVARYDDDGNELSQLRFPVPKVSSVTFGGPNLDLLLVTTAGGDDKRANGALAGAVFCGYVGVKGRRPYLARVRD